MKGTLNDTRVRARRVFLHAVGRDIFRNYLKLHTHATRVRFRRLLGPRCRVPPRRVRISYGHASASRENLSKINGAIVGATLPARP